VRRQLRIDDGLASGRGRPHAREILALYLKALEAGSRISVSAARFSRRSRRVERNAPRWAEHTLYHTASGKYVVKTAGRTTVSGETDRHTVAICES